MKDNKVGVGDLGKGDEGQGTAVFVVRKFVDTNSHMCAKWVSVNTVEKVQYGEGTKPEFQMFLKK